MPYQPWWHYETVREGEWIGEDRELDPACGQRDVIATTSEVSKVDCRKCHRTVIYGVAEARESL